MGNTPEESFEDVRLSADNALAQISVKRAALDKAGRADETLFVLLGEDHTALSHKLHHLALLERVRQNFEAVVLSFEMPHDYAYQDNTHYITRYKHKFSQSQHGEFNLKRTIEKFTPIFARYASDVLNKYSLSGARSGAFKCAYTDASWRFSDYQLNTSDLSTLFSIKACGYDADTIHYGTSEAVYVRNHHMRKSLTRLARDNKARIAIQICGAAHVNGLVGQYGQTKSLAALFLAKSQPFLASVYGGGEYGSDKGLAKGEVLRLRDLQGPVAIYSASNSLVAENYGSDFDDSKQEKDYFDKGLNALGLGHLSQDKLGL
jgi:hypothetical protein